MTSHRSTLLLAVLLFALSCIAGLPSKADGNWKRVTGETRDPSITWNDFFHSSPGTFSANTSYRISFRYKVSASSPDTRFYMVINNNTNKKKTFNFQEWTGKAGETGTVSSLFVDWDSDDYVMVVGIHNRGQLTIWNLQILSDPTLKPLPRTFPAPTRTWTSNGHTHYFVDSIRGSDSSAGITESHPWKTLTKVNSGVLLSGDVVYLRCGSAWSGFLAPAGSGSPEQPITIKSYGAGPAPKIDAHGDWLATVYLSNMDYITVRDLDIANHGKIPQPKLTGVTVSESDFGTSSGIRLDNLSIHDVTGSELKTAGGGAGIDCSCSGDKTLTRFDGLTIENCHLVRTDRNGITMNGEWQRNHWFPSIHVVIAHNVLENIGGDGIVPLACNGALIEYNVLRGGRMRTPDYAAGIWPWSCDNTVIQFNEVSGMRGTNDAQAFDSDWNCNNTTIQYNFSHDNEGGFVLICDDGSQYPPYNSGNIGTVVRYNVSVDDHHFIFNICGPCAANNIYNNSIYVGKGTASELLDGGYWAGWPISSHFTNNVFIAEDPIVLNLGGMGSTTFRNNVYYGKFKSLPNDVRRILANPLLQAPGDRVPNAYRPRLGSPVFRAGEVVYKNGGQDYNGNPVPINKAPTVGAFQK